jgi:hypothetical protein
VLQFRVLDRVGRGYRDSVRKALRVIQEDVQAASKKLLSLQVTRLDVTRPYFHECLDNCSLPWTRSSLRYRVRANTCRARASRSQLPLI